MFRSFVGWVLSHVGAVKRNQSLWLDGYWLLRAVVASL